MKTNRRILVTGGGGFLGQHVVRRLSGPGVQVFAPRSSEYDLTNAEDTERLFHQTKPEIVIHAAALCGGIGANLHKPAEFLYANAMMGLRVIEACRWFGVEKLVVIGTTCSYPKFTAVPFQEDRLWRGFPEETNAPYGVAKRMLLTACQAYRAQYRLNAIYLIPANMYGPGDHYEPDKSHVIPAMIRKFVGAVENGMHSVELWGDGSPTRDFLYVDDAAEGIVRAVEHYNGPEPVNLGTGEEIAMRELADKIAAIAGYCGEIRWDGEMPNGQPRRCLDTSRAEEWLGWEAKTSLEDGLAKTIRAYMNERACVRQEVYAL